MSAIRVGFVYYQVDWLGGINYLRNLLTAIQSLPNTKIQPVLFTGLKSDVSEFKGKVEIVRIPILDRNTLLSWASKFLDRVFPRKNYLLYWSLRKHRIDLLSHFGRLWTGCSIPAIGWIPDFQHVHFPAFFDEKECTARDAHFMDIIRRSDAVIVSSQDGLDDLNSFCSGNTTPTYVLRFVSCLYPKLDELPSRGDLVVRYNLDRPWFHIPNQFWAHKNHIVVLEALNLLKTQGNMPLVIATGSTKDYRNTDYFPAVMKKVHDYGLQDDFLVLGVLPYSDVVALMQYAVAIINPSLYEGWSTSVEESKAIGKKIILSDIAVHREQNPERGQYFAADASNELAKLITTAIQEYDEVKEELFRAIAKREHIANSKNFARHYERIVFQVVGIK